ncbi:ATP-binding protein [Mesorhizobium sp.]|uniref:ATP-binding protein n=1 Tax=Mesorhizobium sp. TaxID=1871066 RepID=UPI00120FAD8F|nr:ATP-binding protein [Mesorhizobium sp.]TIN07907.1 MAG: ATP-binding protein [Mesorhizobium sp.]
MIRKISIPGSDDDYLGFSSYLKELPQKEAYEFDFGTVGFATPAWMIVVGNALRQFRDERPEAQRTATNYKHLGYAAHSGFFQFFGLGFGHAPAAVKSTDRFIPITKMKTDDIRNQAFDEKRHHGDVIQTASEELAEVLLQTKAGDAFDTLTYSLREITRNVIEHSGSEDYAYAAQYWPGSARAEIIISDRGMGIAKSLSSNPKHSTIDDLEAIRLAVQPGVSSKTWRNQRSGDAWANSGYGLYMVRGLCAHGGSFSLLSGSKATTWKDDKVEIADTHDLGTTVIMRLNGSASGTLSDRLADLRKKATKFHNAAAPTEPSTASMSSKVQPTTE